MSKANSIATTWIFVLVMIVPAAMVMAEDPSSKPDQAIREAQPTEAAGGDAAPRPEFRLFEPLPVPEPSAEGQKLAAAAYGIVSTAATAGARFTCAVASGVAYLGYGDYGISGYGNTGGGYFSDLNSSGYAFVAHGEYGIRGYGNGVGGHFEDSNSSGYSNVGEGDYGIRSYGNDAGGYFEDSNSSGYAYVGSANSGISAQGSYQGGYFNDTNTTSYARVGYMSYKIFGTGTVSFVQNHPYDRNSVIVYAAPEGDEVATYTRGTARLVDGEARVSLGETFRWVTNPDIGLTAHLTPRGEPIPLAVVELTTEEMIVRAPNDAPDDLVFDYMVYGLRIGFEESSIVQEKEQESYIPSMADHRQLYERRPELKSYSSLERFKGMRSAVGQKEELDLSRAHALRDAIVEFDPEVHELPGIHERPEVGERMSAAVRDDTNDTGGEQGHGESDPGIGTAAPGAQIGSMAIPMDAEGNVYAASFRPSSRDLASLLEVSEAVEPGDVLVIDRTGSGMMRRASEAADTGVVGVVAASPGVVLGMESPNRMPVERRVDRPDGEPAENDPALRAPVAFAGVVQCKVDAGYGSVWPGDLLVTSPTPGHAMRDEMPLPGTVLGKALESLEEGTGTIRVLVMLR